ncbi:MAG: ATP-binding cassette domain-containing protein [Anaerolineae bacterium]|nr:ATP-binding cassette domain-containing protein [Anaerolineae bacterium]
MKKMTLLTKRPWNWKVLLVLVGLIAPATFAIVPFAFYRLKAYGEAGTSALGWEVLVVDRLINGLITMVLGGIGLVVANRIGLGMPFVESWVKREPTPYRFHSAVAMGWIAGVGSALSIMLLQSQVFGPPMLALFEEIGYVVPEQAMAPPLYGSLAAFYAGVIEETIFRLFGLSLLAWLGGLLFQDPDGRPKLAVLWTANVIFALAFGAAHLPAAEALGWPINALIVTRTLVLNGIGGLVLGWLFWRFGLETAMLAHFFGDVVLYTLVPMVAMQEGQTAQSIALAGVVAVVLLALAWSWRTLVAERRRRSAQTETEPQRQHIHPVAQETIGSDQAICIHNLTMDFESVRALDHLSLEIPPGIIFGFLGPNGAGKTTTIRLLLGLLEPTSGEAQVLGFDTRTQADQIRVRTGALLEHSGIYEQMSAEDNLAFYGRAFLMPEAERKARIQELLTEMGLWERRKERAGTWSRGMKQKLALARTMLHRPRLILLDEPTAGLDVQAAVSVREELACLAAREHVTIFLTTHNMVDAEKLCHQVAVIREGSLIALGSPDELRARAGKPHVTVIGRGFSDGALALLRAHPRVTALKRQNNHLTIDLLEETDTAGLVTILVGAGAHVEEVHRGQASLEDVFLTLTGGQNE